MEVPLWCLLGPSQVQPERHFFGDVCYSWLHVRCVGMSDSEYVILQSSEDSWACRGCLSDALPFPDTSNNSFINSLLTTSGESATDNRSSPMYISSSNQSQPTILYTNCRSLYHKMDKLRSLVSTYSPHLICLCETWLDESIADDELYIPTSVLRSNCPMTPIPSQGHPG